MDQRTQPLIDRINLEKQFGGFEPATQPSHVPNLPYQSPVSVPSSIDIDDSEASDPLQSLRDLSNYNSPTRQGGGTQRSLEEATSPRYLFYSPGEDNEDAYAQGQGWGSKMVNGVGKGMALTATTFLQSTVGMVNGLGEWSSTGRFASFYDNEFNRSLDEINKQLEDSLPNYYSNVEKNRRWYAPAKIFSANFIWDGVIKNMGFAAGAALSGMAYSSVLRALPLTSRLFSIGKQAEAIAAMEQGLLGADKAAGMYGKLRGISDGFLSSYKMMTPAGRAVVAGLATTGEAGFEAFHNLNEFRDEKIREFEEINGRRPIGSEIDQINQLADQVGNTSFFLNTGLLSATNYIQFPRILGSSYKAEKGMISSLAKKIDDITLKDGKYITTPKRGGKVLQALNKVRPYTFSASEAFEEGSQYAISKGVDDYFNKKYRGEDADIMSSIMSGIKETVTTDEGMENVLIGGLSGALMQGYGRFKENSQSSSNTVSALEAFNKFKLSDFTKDTFDSVKRGIALQEERETALVNGDILNSKDLEADYIINYVSPRVKYGRYDLVAADIESYRDAAMTEEGFEELKAEGKALATDTKEAYVQRLNNLQSTADNIKSLYQSLNLRYGNVVDVDGKPVYDEKVLDKMVYAAAKVADYDDRLMKITNEVTLSGVDIFGALKDIVTGDFTKMDKLVEDIINLDVIEETKEELMELVEDAGKLTLRRQNYLKAYDEIKANPTKFVPVPGTVTTESTKADGTPVVKTIKLKTLKGEKEYEIGTEYFLGKVVKYDSKGREVYSFPKLTILGQNEDGTIRIKDKNGPRDIDPAELESYQLGRMDHIAKRENASFYFRNINNIIEMKVRGGKSVKGRLTYSSDNDKLFFVYKNKKGKIINKEIGLDMFDPKEDYKEGLLKVGPGLTAEDKKDIAKNRKNTKDNQTNRRGQRVQILSDLFSEIAEQQEKISNLIDSKRKQLTNINEEIKFLETDISEKNIDKRSKKNIRFRKAAKIALESIVGLSRMRDQLETEIGNLEAQQEDLESELAFISDAESNIDELPTRQDDFLEELRDQVEMLESTIVDIGGQINSLSKLLDGARKAMDSAIKFISDLISDFTKKYPSTPLSTNGQEWIDFVKNNPNFLSLRPDFKSELNELEKFVAETEDSEITVNEKFAKDLSDEIDSLYNQLGEVQKELDAKQRILDRFEGIQQKYVQEKAERESLVKNETVIKQALGTRDTGQRTGVFDPTDTYEPDSKKSTELIPRSTTFPTNSTKPHHDRSNRFGFRLNSLPNRNEIKGVYVTVKNQDQIAPGLIDHLRTDETGNIDDTVDPNQIIALIMVIQNDDGSVTPVDEFGKPIGQRESTVNERFVTDQFSGDTEVTIDTEDFDLNADILGKGIYQVFPLAKLTWKNGDSFFRNDTPAEVQEEIRKQYAEWRKNVLSKDTIEVHTIDASFGHLDLNRDPDGEIDFETRTSPIEAGLITEEDLTTGVVVKVGTSDTPISKGTTSFANPKGRVFLETKNGLVKLNNRRLTPTEAERIYKSILQLAKNMMDPEVTINGKDSKRLLRYLKSMVYWGTPETIEHERKADGYNSIYFDQDKDTGELVLHISGLGKTFVFTPTNLELQKGEIISLIEMLHNDVKNFMLKNVTENYEEITDITPKGEIVSTIWPNYQTFLLSPRKDIPLFTVAKPLQNPDDINRSSIYFYTTDTADDFNIPVPQKKAAVKAPLTPNPTQAKPASSDTVVFDFTTMNTFTTPKGGKILYKVAADVNETNYEEKIKVFKGGTLDDVVKLYTDQGKDAKKEIPKVIWELRVKKALDSQGKMTWGDIIVGEDVAFNGETGEVKTSSGETVPLASEKGKAALDAFYSGQTVTTSEEEEIENALREARETLNDEDEVTRLVTEDLTDVKTENWSEVKAWLKANFPNIPVFRTAQVIQMTGGRQAWGLFQNAAIYVYENAEVGTTYHEVFEAVWKTFLGPVEQSMLVQEFKSRTGKFIDRPTGKELLYSDATESQIREQLAEEFRDYVQFKKAPPAVKGRRSGIFGFFLDLGRFIREFFVGKEAKSNTEKLFSKINEGGFRSIVPYSQELNFEQIQDIDNVVPNSSASFREVIEVTPGITDFQRSEMIQHMTYELLKKLIKTNKSLFEIPTLKKSEVYDDLKKILLRDIGKMSVGLDSVSAQYNPEVIQKGKKRVNDLMKSVIRNWDVIISKHEEYIRSYSIEFDENDEIQRRDENKIKESDYVDATKVDSFKKANGAIKLLLSTLPIVEQNEGTTSLKKSSINGAMLLPTSQAFITIMNRVHDAVNIDEMFMRLKDLAKQDNTYAAFYKRLTKDDLTSEGIPDLSKVTDPHHSQLINAFWRTFKKSNPEVKVLSVLSNGDVAVGEAYLSTVANQLRSDFVSDIINTAKKNKGYLVLARDENNRRVFKGDPEKIKDVKLSNGPSMVEFLKKLGMDFSQKEYNRLSETDKSIFRDDVAGIYESIKSAKNIVSISKQSLDISGRLLSLGYLKAKSSTSDFSSTFFGVEGERKQSFIGTNTLTDFQHFIKSIPKLTMDTIGDTRFKYLKTDVFSRNSHILSKMFNKNGTKITGRDTDGLLTVGYLDGTIDDTRGRKRPTDKYTYPERLVAEINMNLEGWYFNLVPGDASIEWMIKMGNHVSINELMSSRKKVYNIFKGYLLDEIELSRENRKVAEIKGRKNNDLRFFKGILSEALHKSIVSSKKSPEEIYTQYEQEINNSIDRFIESERNDLRTSLNFYGLIKFSDSGLRVEKTALPRDMTEEELADRLDHLVINYAINNIEFHKIFYSDPYQYSDELKRIKLFNSPRQPLINNSDSMNTVLNRIWNRNNRKKSDLGHVNFNRDFLRTASITDINVTGEMERYEDYVESDGAGIISQKAYRNVRIRMGEWNDNEERQFIYDVAFEKRENGIDLNTEEERIYNAGNPKVRSAYTPLKPVVTGNKLDEDGNPRETNDIVGDKFSLYPISYRASQEINPNGNLWRLYQKMSAEDIDYVVFDSGRKIGAEGSVNPYGADGKITKEPFYPVTVPFASFAIQTEVPSKETEKVSRGTQVTKLITMDLMEAGVPVDFMEGKPIDKRFKAWYATPEQDRNTPLYNEIKKNKAILETIITNGFERLLKSMGIEERNDRFVITDFSKATTTLREEILKRETNDNISDALNAFLLGNAVLEATPAYSQIRNILYSIADREVITPKMTGSMKVQIPSSFMESERIVKTKNGKNDIYSADTLKFYVDEDGKRIAEIMVARWFESDKSDDELISILNKELGKSNPLTGLAYRIPTQKQNSIDRFIVKKFLPYEMGDSVVIPSQLVNKAGSDFDIDKLTMYFKNMKIKRGVPTYVEFLDDTNSTPRQRYIEWVKERVDSDDSRYISLMSRKEIARIKKAFASRYKSLSFSTSERIKNEKEALYGEYSTLVKERTEETNNHVDQRVEELFDRGRDIFFDLSDDILQDYFALKARMRMQDINGPKEIENYLALTLSKIERGSDQIDTLQALVDNYEEILQVLGMREAYLTEFKKSALEAFRSGKQGIVESIIEVTNGLRNSIKEEYAMEDEKVKFEAAVDIAEAEKLMDYDSFVDISIYDQNINKALENEFVESSERLISHKSNFKRMTQPNSAKVLKDLSAKVVKKVKGYTFDYTSVPNMLKRGYMSSLRSSFLTGKYAIGIAAVNQTNHSLNQRSPIYIDLDRFDNIDRTDQFYLSLGSYEKKNAVVNFEKFNAIEINGKKVPTLSMIMDSEGKYEISDILSQFVDGYVDISKGPWIIEMGANPNVAATYMFLVKIGVPVDQVVFFMNQPIIVNYLKNLEAAGYSWLFNTSLIESTFEYFSKDDKTGVNLERRIPSAKYLEKQMGRNPESMSVQELEEQRFILLEFLKYSKMTSHLFNITQGSNFDTASFNDPYLIFKKTKQLEKARKTIINSVDSIINESFLNVQFGILQNIRNAYSEILKSDKGNVRKVLENVLEPFVDLPDRDFLGVAQKAVADLFDWAVQTNTNLNREIKATLIDNGGVASQVADFIKSVKDNPNHPLFNNPVVNVLQPLLSSSTLEDKVNVVKVKSLENKVYDQNNIIYGFRQLREYFASKNDKMYENIIRLAVLQSGLSRSSISFTSVIPFEDFEKIYNSTISKIEKIPNLDAFHDLGVFYRNNWNNDIIVPYRRAIWVPTVKGLKYNPAMEFMPKSIKDAVSGKKIPPVMTVSVNSKTPHDYIVYSWEKNIPSKTKEQMRKKGDFSYIQKSVFKMVRDIDNSPLIHYVNNKNKGRIDEYYIFKAINAWGDGQYANEFYDYDKHSVINNGMEKVDNVNDRVIVDMFDKEQKVGPRKERPKTVQPNGKPAIPMAPKKC